MVRGVLMLLAMVAFLFGGLAFLGGKSAIQEIEGLIAFLIFAVFLSGASIIDAIYATKR